VVKEAVQRTRSNGAQEQSRMDTVHSNTHTPRQSARSLHTSAVRRHQGDRTLAAMHTISIPLGQMAPPSAVTALGLRITCVCV
jgi:hypothetical protein